MYKKLRPDPTSPLNQKLTTSNNAPKITPDQKNQSMSIKSKTNTLNPTRTTPKKEEEKNSDVPSPRLRHK